VLFPEDADFTAVSSEEAPEDTDLSLTSASAADALTMFI
jgi:hypothetical protein